jgi:RNA polymerase sigma-70 factor (ECF subfamily)
LDDALKRARNGEEEGFVELWRTLHPPLLRYLTVRRNDSPEDLAAEAWLQVVRDLAKFSGDARDFRAFLFTVARNRAIDQGRARASRPVVSVAEPESSEASPSAETLALERISTQAALDLVATLPPEQAEMVMLRVVAGLDVAAVAAIVGKKPGTVRVSVHRALRTLARDPRAKTDVEHEEVV